MCCITFLQNKQFIKDVRVKDQEERERTEAEKQQLEGDRALSNVEDNSRSSSPKTKEPVVVQGRGEPHEVENKGEPNAFSGNENEQIERKENKEVGKKQPFSMSPSKPSEGKHASPVSYAGWKPSDIP